MSGIPDLLHDTLNRIDDCRSHARWALAAQANNAAGTTRLRLDTIGGIFVITCGALEKFAANFTKTLLKAIEKENRKNKDITHTLYSLASTNTFRSLQDIRDPEKLWETRISLITNRESGSNCSFSPEWKELGLAGKTLRPSQVGLIWEILNLPGEGFQSIQQQVSLRVFADNRNDFAHGNVSPVEFSRNPECSPKKILERLSHLESWCFHCWQQADDYLKHKSYLR